MRIQHWQDIGSLAVGMWLLASPWALGLEGAAAVLTVVLAIAVILFALEGFLIPSYLEEWCEAGVGIALMVLPWVAGYGDQAPAATNSVLAGLFVLLFAVWELVDDPELKARWQAWRQAHGHHLADH